MNALALVQLIIELLTGVASAANQQGLVSIADAAGVALTELEQVTGTDVTKGQLDSLRVTAQW